MEQLLEGLDDSGDFLDPAALHGAGPAEARPVSSRNTHRRVHGPPDHRLGCVGRRVPRAAGAAVPHGRSEGPAARTRRRSRSAGVSRSRRELLGQLQHPGIAHIYAAHSGDDTTPPFIAMELVVGPADHRLRRAHGS